MTDARILVVEDESLVADSIVAMLENLRYAVSSVATSGEEAIQQAGETQPDLVLMDISLPGEMDGVEAAQVIQGRFDTPVVFLTAYADDETLRRAKITQPFGYVLKPFQKRELHGAIEMALYRHEMEQKLRASEARYRAISEITSDYAYAFVVEPDGTVVPEWETEAFKRITGYSTKEVMELGGWESLVHPDDLAIARQHFQAHVSGQSNVSEHRIVTKGGEVRWLRAYGQPVWDDTEGRVVRFYGAAQDITEQVKAQEALRRKLEDQAALYRVSQVFLDQSDVKTTLRNICRLAVEDFGLNTSWIGLIKNDSEIQPVAAYGFEGDYHKLMQNVSEHLSDFSGLSSAIGTGQPFAINLDSDPASSGWRSVALDRRARSLASLPLSYNGKVLGVLNVSSADPAHFSEDRVQLLQSFANLAAVALQKARYRERIQRDAAELEQRIAKRTEELRLANKQLQQEVAERVRAEQALRESEESFRTIADFTHDWEYWTTPDGHFIYISPSCERVTGYSADEFQKDPHLLQAIVHPDDCDTVVRHLHQESNSRAAMSAEFRIIARDGQERWIDHVCQPVYSADGRWLGQRASNREITDRKRVEETLRRYERIVSATPDLMALLDKNCVYQAVNDTYLKAFGKGRDEIIGHCVADLLGQEVFETLLKNHLERCLQGIATQYQAWLEFPRRGRRFMSVTYYPYFDVHGDVSGIVVSSRDITDLKRTEEALRRSEIKYRAMFTASPDYLYVTDMEGRFLDANPAFLKWAGVSREEIQQRYFMHFFAGERIQELQIYFEKIRRGQEIKKLEMRIKNTRGETLECEINALPLIENAQVTAVLNVARDITERLRVERALHESEERYRVLLETSLRHAPST